MSLIPSRLISNWQLRNAIDHDINVNEYKWKFIAEGDSWFSYGSAFGNSLLNEFAFENTSTLITQFATPGDTMRHMSDWTGDPNFSSFLRGKPAKLEHHFDAILISGGGNDLIDAVSDRYPGMRVMKQLAPGTVLTNPDDCIDDAAWQRFSSYINKSFTTVSSMRASSASNSKTPIFAHTYDYVMPRNAPPLGTNRTYLLPALKAHNIAPEQYWLVAQHVFEKLSDLLLAIKLPNFHVVDTAGTLVAAVPGSTGDSNDWLNEIHPNAGGYKKLAALWRDKITSVL